MDTAHADTFKCAACGFELCIGLSAAENWFASLTANRLLANWKFRRLDPASDVQKLCCPECWSCPAVECLIKLPKNSHAFLPLDCDDVHAWLMCCYMQTAGHIKIQSVCGLATDHDYLADMCAAAQITAANAVSLKIRPKELLHAGI